MMSTGAVYVAMRQFFRRSVAYLYYFDSKVQFNAGQLVVGIYGHGFRAYFCYGYYATLAGRELHARLYGLVAERRERYLLHHRRVFVTVALIGGDLQLKFVACLSSFQTFLHAGYQVTDAMDIIQRFASVACIDDRTCIVAKRIVDRGHSVLGDLHA